MVYRVLEKKISISDVAEIAKARLVGKTDGVVCGICSNNEPRENCLTLFTGSSKKQLRETLFGTKVTAVLVKEGNSFDDLKDSVTLLYVANPIAALVSILSHFVQFADSDGVINQTVEIHKSAKLGKNISIGAFSVIGEGAEIGDNVVIHPHVVIYPFAKVGSNSILHSGATIREYCEIGKFSLIQNGAVIGSDGFGYFFDGSMLRAVPQIGTTKLADYVDIGANTCIDRATLGTTSVDMGTKLDNLVQVGHNVKIGKMSILCGQVGIAGSAIIGNGVTLGGQAGVGDNAVIPDKCRFAGQSSVFGKVTEAMDYAGSPAVPLKDWKRQIAALRKLPSLFSKLKK